MNKALYIHVPFCKNICFYCDFCHFKHTLEIEKRWFKAFKKEYYDRANFKASSIYIGGGTPTSLSLETFKELLELISNSYIEGIEYTIEINPESFDEDKAKLLKKYHINRASIGLISSNDNELKYLGRHHNYHDVIKTVELLNKYDINNYSLDLLYSFQPQTITSFKKSIQDAISLNPKHLSLYSLTIEENTLFHKNNIEHFDDDTEAIYYELAKELFESDGFYQYEVSNFAKEGYESRHNLVYWHYEDFVGISLGASSKINHQRMENTRNLNDYEKGDYYKEIIDLNQKDEMFEMIMMGMRLNEGVDLIDFEKRFNKSIFDAYNETLLSLIDDKRVVIKNNHLVCNNLEILNEILINFLD